MGLGLMQSDPSVLQYQKNGFQDTGGKQGESEVSDIRVSAGGLPPGQHSRGQAAAIVPFLSLPSHRATEQLYHI